MSRDARGPLPGADFGVVNYSAPFFGPERRGGHRDYQISEPKCRQVPSLISWIASQTAPVPLQGGHADVMLDVKLRPMCITSRHCARPLREKLFERTGCGSPS